MVWITSITLPFGGARTSYAARRVKKFCLFLFLFLLSLSVTFLNDNSTSPWRRRSIETVLVPLDGDICSCVPGIRMELRLTTLGKAIAEWENWNYSTILSFTPSPWATEYTDSDEIWQVSVDRGSTLACQIWSWSVKGMGTEAPQYWQNWSNLRFLALTCNESSIFWVWIWVWIQVRDWAIVMQIICDSRSKRSVIIFEFLNFTR